MKIETPGVEKAKIRTGEGWQITQQRLFDVSPEDADKVEVRGGKITIWQLCFVEDLLQVVNRSRGVVLDVGWYPDSRPEGSYRLRLIHEKKGERIPYDWENPEIDFTTRSLSDLLAKIHSIVS